MTSHDLDRRRVFGVLDRVREFHKAVANLVNRLNADAEQIAPCIYTLVVCTATVAQLTQHKGVVTVNGLGQ